MTRIFRLFGCIGFLAAVLVFSSYGCAESQIQTAENPPVKITALGDKLKVEINGKLFTEYVYKNVAQPHFYPIVGPTGEIIVRQWPVKEGADEPYEQHDHAGHIGLWFGHMMNGNKSFWCGGKVHEKFLEIASGDTGIIKTQSKWITDANDGNQTICTTTNTYKFYSKPEDAQIMDCEITFHASNGPLTFNDSKEGSMAIRLATSLAQNLESKAIAGRFRYKRQPGEEPGHIVNSDGVRDADAFGKRAAWCDYYGTLKGEVVGVAIFDHPKNPAHPTSWMVRDYGLFAANPFGISELSDKKGETAGELTIPAGQSLTLKYRFYFHKGDEKQANVAELYKEYVAADCPKAAAGKCSRSATQCVK